MEDINILEKLAALQSQKEVAGLTGKVESNKAESLSCLSDKKSGMPQTINFVDVSVAMEVSPNVPNIVVHDINCQNDNDGSQLPNSAKVQNE